MNNIKTKKMYFKKIFAALILSLAVSVSFMPNTALAETKKHCWEGVSGLKDTLNACTRPEVQGTTSFVEFEGGLQPPSGKGLAKELTEVSSARDFILRITNFALSFLGLIAVLIIIYGGFLYLTAGAGQEEQTGKGKKAIMYAVVGILIILSSYAIVNTLLKAPKQGFEDRPYQEDAAESESRSAGVGAGTAPGGTDAVLSGRIFNLAALEVRTSNENFVRIYDRYGLTSYILENIKELSAPRGPTELRSFLATIEQAMNVIRTTVPSTYKSYSASNNVLKDFVRKWMNLSEEEIESLFSRRTSQKLPFAETAEALSLEGFYASGSGEFHAAFKKAMDDNFYTPKPHMEDFKDEINKIILRLNLVRRGLGPVGEAPAEETIRSNVTSEEELRRLLAGIPVNFTVNQAFDEVISDTSDENRILTDTQGSLQSARDELAENYDNTSLIDEVVEKLDRLFTVVKDIKFMAVRINASAVKGSAPMGIQFTSLGSLDPSGETIADEQHEWDLDGNGVFDERSNSLGCDEQGGANVYCVYNEAGTYRISLYLKPKEGRTQTAAGIAVLTIQIAPRSSRIELHALNNNQSEALFKLTSEGKTDIAKSTYTITLEEAKAGVTFDAQNTKDGGGNPVNLFEWSFGDGTQPIIGANSGKVEKKTYNRVGTFPLKLEVTDRAGKKDRVFVNVIVSSIAARINAQSLRGDLNTAFAFDGSGSKSDLGAIESYEWKIFDQDGKEIPDLRNNTSDSFRYTFRNPGRYKVSLKILDKAGNEASSSVFVSVESQKPHADFEIKGCIEEGLLCLDPSQPSLIELDAAKSFDPDQSDRLSYTWEFLNAVAVNDFMVISGKLKSDTPSDPETKKIKVKFSKIGTFKAKLSVEDQHLDPNIRKKDTIEKEFKILSAVDLSWDSSMTSVQKLNGQGHADITFKANVKNADKCLINFGDSGNETQCDNSISGGKMTIHHMYGSAGVFTADLKASSDSLGRTAIQKQIHIGAADAPIAVIEIKKDDIPLIVKKDEPILALRKEDRLLFDANGSLNSKGSKEGLEYSWNFGDGIMSAGVTATHIYENISPADPGYFEVKLTLIDENPETHEPVTAESKVKIQVIGAKPVLTALTSFKKSEGEETPLDYELKVQGGRDADGEIKEYTFWYFDEDEPDRKLGIVTTNRDNVILRIETKGLAGEEKKYSFCVEMKDNENNVSTCNELFPDEKLLPFAVVKNGPNQSPAIDISVDRPIIKTGESAIFSARATDPDGRVVKYVWDVLGDGFHNDTETDRSQITQKYDEKSPRSGYRVRAKAIDDFGAEGFSNEITIRVESPFNPPVLRDFTAIPIGGAKIRFTPDVQPAPGSNAILEKFIWDFNTDEEGCTAAERACPQSVCAASPELCDRTKDNDPDSTARAPEHEYDSSGNYSVRLIVEDSNGQKAEKVKIVEVRRGAAPEEAPIKAILRVQSINGRAARKSSDGKYHLTGNGAEIVFFVGDSRGNISKYSIDQNIFYDSDGDGRTETDKSNDENFTRTSGAEAITATYLRNFPYRSPEGYYIARLTVTGRDEQGRPITDTTSMLDSEGPDGKDAVFVFDPLPGAASIFEKFGIERAILLGLLGGAILAVMGYVIAGVMRKGKPRMI